ncbi:hypothetical protein GUITHDRAFT_104929 [Guillardia theta CCMP2712]|uniref:Uncharacterized protein n=1 Tax=Guillardia theta (strain CCMP2712) TaxID=905079 RepID=L1JMH7_GUITC|nr:hypothetical protein GUITHDRAFT_104929 [Guillardia theta CCMP2712]EKX49400.1 hypothetical protein GUITHDRAFT_104929 [Guillardia theta CCMP2712]|eukprot:XP_005836380.1 hypothetical protein GUITHDRAFT_104929 [Guillardia theta CCMP2712]
MDAEKLTVEELRRVREEVERQARAREEIHARRAAASAQPEVAHPKEEAARGEERARGSPTVDGQHEGAKAIEGNGQVGAEGSARVTLSVNPCDKLSAVVEEIQKHWTSKNSRSQSTILDYGLQPIWPSFLKYEMCGDGKAAVFFFDRAAAARVFYKWSNDRSFFNGSAVSNTRIQ